MGVDTTTNGLVYFGAKVDCETKGNDNSPLLRLALRLGHVVFAVHFLHVDFVGERKGGARGGLSFQSGASRYLAFWERGK